MIFIAGWIYFCRLIGGAVFGYLCVSCVLCFSLLTLICDNCVLVLFACGFDLYGTLRLIALLLLCVEVRFFIYCAWSVLDL